jgi:hypothetical protein
MDSKKKKKKKSSVHIHDQNMWRRVDRAIMWALLGYYTLRTAGLTRGRRRWALASEDKPTGLEHRDTENEDAP